MVRVLMAVLIAFVAVFAAASEPFDIVLKGGRVVDPETGLDGVRDVGVRGDHIAADQLRCDSKSRGRSGRGVGFAYACEHVRARSHNSGPSGGADR